MVVIMKPGTREEDIQALVKTLETYGVKVSETKGVECSILGLVGDTSNIDKGKIEMNRHVDKVMRVQESYKKANRKFHPDDTVIHVGSRSIGNGQLAVIAGPCSVESREQVKGIAREVKRLGASFLRGGAYKPRTSPYSFQGLEREGIDMLIEARAETGMPIVSEIMSPKLCDLFEREVDVIQVGTRNMQNFDLLKELGRMSKPILLKRGISSTIEEWLMSAEYILAGGNEQVVLCERGIRTFETYTRNTLDVSAIPVVKRLSHLPVIVDPSHASGMSWMVEPLSLAATAAGADGLMIEVHNDPPNAKCDGQQSLTPESFGNLMKKLAPLAKMLGKEIEPAGEIC